MNGFNDAQAVIDTDLLKDTVDVILDGLLGQIQVIRDFLIGHSALDQGNQLLLASSQAKSGSDMAVRGSCRAHQEVIVEQPNVSWRANTFPLCNRTYRVDDFDRRCILKDIAKSTQSYRGEETLLVVFHRHQEIVTGSTSVRLGMRSFLKKQQRIKNDHIGSLFSDFALRPVGPDWRKVDLKIRLLPNYAGDRFSQKAVTAGNENIFALIHRRTPNQNLGWTSSVMGLGFYTLLIDYLLTINDNLPFCARFEKRKPSP